MTTRIIDRGRGPEIEGTRVSIDRVMDFVRAGDPGSRIADDLDLTDEQAGAALADIDAHRDEVNEPCGTRSRGGTSARPGDG